MQVSQIITGINYYAFPIATGIYLIALIFFVLRQSAISIIIFICGFCLHTLFQLSRGLYWGLWLPNPIFDLTYFLPWVMTAVSMAGRFLIQDEDRREIINSMIIPVCFFSLVALIFPREISPHVGPKHETIFVALYYGIDNIALSCFILGAWFAIFHLRGKDQDKMFNSFIVAGFIFYSISQVVGAYWAYLGWALPMHWSTRHLQSASIWCFYAAVLHLRYFPAWNSRHEAWFALGGAALLLTFVHGDQISALILSGIRG
jgi:ABC-type uncharacterized transport system permease subunit